MSTRGLRTLNVLELIMKSNYQAIFRQGMSNQLTNQKGDGILERAQADLDQALPKYSPKAIVKSSPYEWERQSNKSL